MKIYSPNREYTGISASVPFCSGAGETEDPYLIEWFKSHGYEIEKTPEVKDVSEDASEDMKESLPETSRSTKKNRPKSEVNK
mgnify:CR=1 FL=1